MGLFSRKAAGSQKKPTAQYGDRKEDYEPKKVNEKNLRETGLRGGKLLAVVCCVAVLWIVSIGTFVCNLMMLRVLRMNHRGMQTMQFHRTDSGQPTIRFTGQQTHLDTVVPKSGLISSAGNSKFEIEGSKIQLINKRRDQRGDNLNDSASITIEKDHVYIGGVENFFVADPKTSRVFFEASKPIFKLEKNIRTLSSNSITTNKVRSPIDQHLIIDVENLMFRGNEGNYFSARNIFIRARHHIFLKTGQDNGRMNFTASKGVRFSVPSQMKISTSPHIGANLLAKRLCACEGTGKLFVVPGNKPCAINPAYCY